MWSVHLLSAWLAIYKPNNFQLPSDIPIPQIPSLLVSINDTKTRCKLPFLLTALELPCLLDHSFVPLSLSKCLQITFQTHSIYITELMISPLRIKPFCFVKNNTCMHVFQYYLNKPVYQVTSYLNKPACLPTNLHFFSPQIFLFLSTILERIYNNQLSTCILLPSNSCSLA